jgi:hypothetical protein
MSYTPPAGDAAEFSWQGKAAYTAPAGDAADLSFAPTELQGWVAVDGPLGVPTAVATAVRQAWGAADSLLGQPALFGASNTSLVFLAAAGPLGGAAVQAVQVATGWVQSAGPLGEVAILAQRPIVGWLAVAGPLRAPAVQAILPTTGTLSAPAILGAARVLALHDFTGQIGDVVTRYVMDLVTPTGTVRVPISSWQATLQTGRSNYVQAVVPAVLTWVTAINAATEFVISRTATLPDGTVIEYEMARAPVGEARFDRGPTRYTCTLSGYATGFAVDEDPDPATDRVLSKVRSNSSGSGGIRVRCAVDWLLRPGQRAIVDGSPFTVAYINYYVGGGDAYMDAGERN